MYSLNKNELKYFYTLVGHQEEDLVCKKRSSFTVHTCQMFLFMVPDLSCSVLDKQAVNNSNIYLMANIPRARFSELPKNFLIFS